MINEVLKKYLKFFFLKAEQGLEYGITRKRSTKRLKHTRNLFRRNLKLEDVS